jgi:hypothetical protein
MDVLAIGSGTRDSSIIQSINCVVHAGSHTWKGCNLTFSLLEDWILHLSALWNLLVKIILMKQLGELFIRKRASILEFGINVLSPEVVVIDGRGTALSLATVG